MSKTSVQVKPFFSELAPRLEWARAADRDRYQRFFGGLAPRLKMARDVERELDRKLAHRFNVLSYLRDNELGLSRIIADLLNPQARHGQGGLFLECLLNLLKDDFRRQQHGDAQVLFLECLLNLLKGRFEVGGHFDEQSSVTVECERSIKDKHHLDISGRLDISVEIQAKYCLVIENKLRADDQPNQVKNYLDLLKGKYEKHLLKGKYEKRFLLIYLSPTGAGPSEKSIKKEELKKSEWQDRFAIMPYWQGRDESNQEGTGQEDEFSKFRIKSSLADWLGECRKNCEVERLRWFLSDAEQFCQQTVGGQTMTTDSEKEQVKEFLFENPSNIKTAQAVHDAWPEVKQEICRKFLDKLQARIEQAAKNELSQYNDIKLYSEYPEKKEGQCACILLYRECWKRYENKEYQPTTERTSVCLHAQFQGPNGWIIGVSSPLEKTNMVAGDEERYERLREDLEGEFGNKVTDWWPRYENVKYKNWDSLVPELHQESKSAEGGKIKECKIMEYYVNKFIEVAKTAIPIIDRIEK